ncbi:unnamed protein product [Cuscuta campestris]|uniref:Uncharacterized protein n=1 Tax=Cuscuta campestris TaxID=132261 RepID=A0A484M1K1_9ASTE|nr:unnamed protein product [Cuscuta campestris]
MIGYWTPYFRCPERERVENYAGSADKSRFFIENYNIAFRVLDEALKNCVNVNNRTGTGCSSNIAVIRDVDEENQGSHATRTTKKKSVTKKRKVCLRISSLFVNIVLLHYSTANAHAPRYNLSPNLQLWTLMRVCTRGDLPQLHQVMMGFWVSTVHAYAGIILSISKILPAQNLEN